ncbi:hypothetical protein TWF696_006665 [Orbilia brochopaga]|uniref:Uncharacterized protein n=1 Tax=Orbilia brochopaga TaxID=3140254 RepID=A0AAV9UPE4_9PEZI
MFPRFKLTVLLGILKATTIRGLPTTTPTTALNSCPTLSWVPATHIPSSRLLDCENNSYDNLVPAAIIDYHLKNHKLPYFMRRLHQRLQWRPMGNLLPSLQRTALAQLRDTDTMFDPDNNDSEHHYATKHVCNDDYINDYHKLPDSLYRLRE